MMETQIGETPREMPTWDQVREALVRMGRSEGIWAGVPLPVDGLSMTIEEKYPFKNLEERFGDIETVSRIDVPEDADDWFLHSCWHSTVKRGMVYVFIGPQGKVRHQFVQISEYERIVQTMLVAASPAWSIEAELAAIAKLGKLISRHMLDIYMLTGTFLESSKRSGIVYIFRRLAPTIAVRPGHGGAMIGGKVLATLCAHPIAYYNDSWAGAMVPTDDVVSHLIMMRGDEHFFWRRCNQHDPNAVESRMV